MQSHSIGCSHDVMTHVLTTVPEMRQREREKERRGRGTGRVRGREG